MSNTINNLDAKQFKHIGKNLKAAEEIRRPSQSYWQDAYRRLKKHKPAVISFWILLFLIVMSLIGPIISFNVNGHTYRSQDLNDQNQATILSNRQTKEDWNDFINNLNTEAEKLLVQDPDFRGLKFTKSGSTLIIKALGEDKFNTRYWFGTDEFGRDLFTRLWQGGRISFLIAFIAVFFTVIFGTVYGGVSGFFGGALDNTLMRFIEIIMVVPDMLYIILLLSVLKPGLGPIIIVLASTSWMGTARIVRGEILRLKHSEYVIAAEKLGASSARIIFKHLIPNTMGPIIVNTTMMIPRMIFSEAFLSFIGLGVPVPIASWGSLINDGARIFTQQPVQLFVPGIALSLTMLAFNILGDGLRDSLDPRLRK